MTSRIGIGQVRIPNTHDLDGDTFRLSPDVAYLKLSSVRSEDIQSYLERAKGTKGLIVDIRNYPSAPVVDSLGEHLIQRPTPFVHYINPELRNPGTMSRGPEVSLYPQLPTYQGRVVIVVDEISLSQAEYTAMALRVAPHAVVVGSQTTGADGSVSPVALPFGLNAAFSGLGILTPEDRQTQQVGIACDIQTTPTMAGIAAGRDEVLETSIRQILGNTVTQSDIERMAHR